MTERNETRGGRVPPVPDLGNGVQVRPISGYPGYCVTSVGEVWSCRDFQGGTNGPWRRLRGAADKDGYRTVTLSDTSRKKKTRRLAHVVLEAFVGPRPDGHESCHYPDPSPLNNRLENLRWATHAENISDKVRSQTVAKGEAHGSSKLTARDVVAIRAAYAAGKTCEEVGREFGVTGSHVASIVKGKYWKHIHGEPKTKGVQPRRDRGWYRRFRA